VATAEQRRAHTESQFTRLSQEVSSLRGQLNKAQQDLAEANDAKVRAEAAADALRGVLRNERLEDEGQQAETAATSQVEADLGKKRSERELADREAAADSATRRANITVLETALDSSAPFWRKVTPPRTLKVEQMTEAQKAFVQYRALQPELVQRAATLDVEAAKMLFDGFAKAYPQHAGGQATAVPGSEESDTGRPASPARRGGVMRPKNTGLPPASKDGASDIDEMPDEEFNQFVDGARSKAGVI
jgi:hypothetical protein